MYLPKSSTILLSSTSNTIRWVSMAMLEVFTKCFVMRFILLAKNCGIPVCGGGGGKGGGSIRVEEGVRGVD